jgi:predicted lipoprotein with Yx(FWY)xxD motif
MNRNIILGGTILGAAAAAGIGIAVAGSGSGGGAYSSGGNGATKPAPNMAAAANVQAAQTRLGAVLVDSRGRSLYLFEKDTANASKCAGSCASIWPPLTTTGVPHAMGAAQASLVGSVRRSDGAMQVTYRGHPLYLYVGDNKTGDVNGQGLNQFGAVWEAVGPSGSGLDSDG